MQSAVSFSGSASHRVHRAPAAAAPSRRLTNPNRVLSWPRKGLAPRSAQVDVTTATDPRVEALELAVLKEELNRRAGRRCELCEGWKGGLQPYNARSEGDDGEAQLRDYMLVCGSCQKVIDVEAQGYKPRELNFLKVAALSEVPVVMQVAVSLLEKVTGEKVKPLVCGEKCQDVWAHESLDFF